MVRNLGWSACAWRRRLGARERVKNWGPDRARAHTRAWSGQERGVEAARFLISDPLRRGIGSIFLSFPKRVDASEPAHAASSQRPNAYIALTGPKCLTSVNRYGQICNQSVSVSVALLLARFGSVIPLGGVTFALLEREPVADALIVPAAL